MLQKSFTEIFQHRIFFGCMIGTLGFWGSTTLQRPFFPEISKFFHDYHVLKYTGMIFFNILERKKFKLHFVKKVKTNKSRGTQKDTLPTIDPC